MKSLEDEVKQKMNNARISWIIDHWYPSFWSWFKKEKPCPSRYVSKEEADKALERLKNYASVAQSGERQPVKLDVVGSKPT